MKKKESISVMTVEMKYSVLMSVYHKEKAEYLKLAIESMLKQTVLPDQIVLVEDGLLNENLDTVIAEYENNPLFTIVKLEENMGLGRALDEGLKYCRNELVARMDSDDISLPKRCEKELALFADDPDLDIVSGTIAEFETDPSNIKSHRIVPAEDPEIRKQMRRRSAFNHPAVMYKKSAVIRCGGYGGSLRKEDHDLFSRMVNMGCHARNLQEDVLLYRTGENAIRRRKSWKNISSYLEIMWVTYKRGYCSLWDVIYVDAAQLFYFIAPVGLINFLLKKFFRK